MDAFGVLDEVLDDYENFVKGFLEIKDDQIRSKVEKEIADGLLWPEPWLALNPAFESGGTVSELVERKVLHPEAVSVFRARTEQDQVGKEITFHRHQTDAFEIANRRESYVLTTGTGSGKSMAYIVPIVDRVLREGSGKGVRAIIVYPMNALANSQRNELEKFLGKTNPKVSFARYTGQENREEREKTLASPPDILLTNYVMLELMLTRPKERQNLISSAANLSFLVLDELHTYRGRQGADVAMLVRRLRGAVASNDVQCIGTSATLAGPGTKAEQRQEVAELATRIFGVEIPAANIVGETLRRATTGDADPAALTARLAAPAPTEWADLKADPLAVWTEQHFGLHTDDEGKLARRPPSKLSDAATKLHDETGGDEAVCREKLQELLLAGSRTRDPQGRSLFAFKLHQFIGKGDTVYTTLEPPAKRFLTTQYQRSAPNRPSGQPLFPLAFCRECGQEFLVVNLERGGENFSPRIPNSDLVENPDADGLLLPTEQPWPDPQDPALLELVPEDWVISGGGGQVLDKARIPKLPSSLRVDEFGTITDDGMPVAFFERLEFCPSCKTSYESSQQSQFSRVASLGTEGRASAVTVLSQSIVRALRSESDLDDEARKFLAFSDNRQDASLQAGHFNDFVLVGLIRSALYRAAADYQEQNPGEPLTDENLGPEVVKALSGTSLKFFARDEETADEHIPRKKIARALRDVVAYRLWADLKRGWRITMPNLEQTGQLRLAYEGVDELAANDNKWASCGEPLASASAETRREVMHVLLDELRRNLCIDTEFLTDEKFDAVRRAGFKDLVKAIRDTSNLLTRFTDDDLDNQPLDEILGKINDDHRVDVHQRIHELTSKADSQPSPLHEAIVRLASASTIRMVTTNYDHHLSTQLGNEAKAYLAPALPMGDDFTGIVYIHGRLDQDSRRLICTDDDFGKAYLTDAWAARFLDRMFATRPVLFVGYSHNDTIMKYLARGLGGRSQNRYALTADAGSPLWRQLGITPIECSYDDQPLVLNDWAALAAEGLLGHRARVKALVAEQDLSPVPDAVSYLETVIGDKNTARFFTEFARGQSWLQWVSGRPEFATLFWPAPNVVPDVTHALAKWFADNYVNDDDVSDVAFQMVAESGPHLVDDFAFTICQQLSRHQGPLSKRMRRWLLLVTGGSENRPQAALLASMLDGASLATDPETVLFLFDYLTEPRVAASGRHFGATFEATTRGNHSMLRSSWDMVYRPFLDQYASQLLAIIDRHLRRADLQLTIAGESDRERPSLWRPAISIVEDHQLGTPLGFLIDAARECLESLLAAQNPEADRYLEAWAESDVVLLRRLAIHGWTYRTDKASSERLQWFLGTGWLHSVDLRAEASRLVIETVGSADPQSVTVLIDDLLARSEDDEYGPWRAAALLASIKEANPNLAGVDEGLATLAMSHPEIAEQDGGNSSQEPSAWDTSPPTDVEQLHQQLGEAPAATVDALIACEEDTAGWENQRRWEQLAGAISALTQQYPEDGFVLLDLIGLGHAEISNSVVRGWAQTTADEHIIPQILTRISYLEVEPILRQVTAMLGGFGSQSQPRGWHRFDESVELAKMCWEAIDPQAPSAFSDGNDFLTTAINHPAGQLATYWVDRVGHLWRDAADSWNGIPPDLAGYLVELSSHDDSRGEAVRTVFSAYLAFFHAADRDWCRQFLMPMLDWSDPSIARMAWTGYLSHGRGSDELLADGFLDLLVKALGHRHELNPRASRNLPLLLAKIAVESGVDPGTWINSFVTAGSTTDLVEWAQDVGHELRALDPAAPDAQWGRWIRDYLAYRIRSIPKALAPEEVSAMAVWVLYLSDSMGSAIELLLRVSSAGLDMHNLFLHELRDERIEREPESLARLAASLLGATTGQFYGALEVQRVYRRFKDCGVSPDALGKIAEAALGLGFQVE